MKNVITILISVFTIVQITAQNPISPPGIYLADPSARVFKDGKLYIYGSLDESPEYYCSTKYNLLSTNNMVDWVLTENIFSSKGENDLVDYSDEILYAPDAIYRNGTYFLYYCLARGKQIEGVAMSTSPTGPYSKGEPIQGAKQIDPAAFIDDDGQAYYFWGQFLANGAKMKENMKEIESESIIKNLLTEKEHHFHEGINMFKRNDVYYLVYTQINDRGLATSIGYSYSKSPLGPYTYGGVIIDNYGCDPYTWNNHGSVQEYKGQWYIFYHRSTHGSNSMRKACVEPIKFTIDGLIPEVEMTSQGASSFLNPYKPIESEWACWLSGMVRVEQFSKRKEGLSKIENDDKAIYKYFYFDRKPKTVHFRIKPKEGGKITLYTSNFVMPINAYLEVPANSDSSSDFVEYTASVSGIDVGKYPIYLKFNGEKNKDLFIIDSFWFE